MGEARDWVLAASVVVLWLVVIALAFMVFALARQIGVLHERVAPAGALMPGSGPKVGELAPKLEVTDLGGGTVSIGGASDAALMILFVSPTCPVCKSLVPAKPSLAAKDAFAGLRQRRRRTGRHQAYAPTWASRTIRTSFRSSSA